MRIFCDSSCDLLKDEIKELGVHAIPFPYSLNGEEHIKIFETEEEFSDFYKQIRAGATPSTACINAYTYEEIFTPHLEQGEDILYIHLSSGLTGTFNYAPMVISNLKEKFPNRKVFFLDSLHVTTAIGMLIKKAVELKNQGKTIEQIRDFIEIYKTKIGCYFCPEDLFYLKRGGRISLATAVGGTILNVKPLCKIGDNGKLIRLGVVPGKKGVIKKLATLAKENARESDFPITIMHADNLQEAQLLESEIKNLMPNKEVQVRPVGPIIGTHAGPGTLAVVFYSDKR